MFKQCTVPSGETIAKGDAVCVTDFDTTNNRPTIKRATRDNLATSKTVFGVAENNAVFEDDAVGGSVFVLMAGEVTENAITSLGAGKSNIVATDIHNATEANQCRLKRIERPNGSEFVVGTCDENGNLVLQPRASRETSTLHGFNVKSYDALGNGAADDSLAINNAVKAIAASGGRLFFPSGTYLVRKELTIPPHVHVTFEEGAMLKPYGAAVTIEGSVTCHPAQQVFGGTGVNSPVIPSDPGLALPTVTVSGSAFGNYLFLVQIMTGGALGTATFKYSLDGGNIFSLPVLTAAGFPLPTTGLTIGFGPGAYKKDSTYSWTSRAPITLGSAAFDRFSVRNFGAVPDWTPSNPVPTDNLPYFQAALGAMSASGNRSAKLVADGHFYLSDTLVLTQTIVLEGAGQNEPPPFLSSGMGRSTPGTMLVFPKNVTGIRIRGGSALDNSTKTLIHLFPPSGEKTILRNLTVYCNDIDARAKAKECRDQEDPCIQEGDCIHGIHASAPVRLENVTVEFFAHDGIHIVGAECGKPLFDEQGNPVLDGNGDPVQVYDGNADGSYVENCSAGQCGRDGFHFSGGDAQTCVINRCSGVVNGRSGFYDATFGNTYLGCHSEANIGPNYITELDVNASVFINCWSEAGSPPSQFHGQPTIISGKIGGNPQYMTWDSSAFILEHGVATRAPLVYQNYGHNQGTKPFRISLGDGSVVVGPPGELMVALSWATLDATGNPDDSTWLHYIDGNGPGVVPRRRHWWELTNNDFSYRHMMRFPTTLTNARQPAPWFPNGIFIGRDDDGLADDPPKVIFTAAPEPPKTQYNSSNSPMTYEQGDVVWNSEPSAGGSIGQVCITSGTQGQLRLATTGDLLAFDTTLTLANPTSFAVNQYVTIAGVSGIRQIVALAGNAATLDTAGDNAANIVDGAVAVKMIGTILNGSADLVVDDISRLIIGQYIAITGVTGGQKIVSLGAPAALECATAETYDFDDGFTLVVKIDNGPVQTVIFHTADFIDIHADIHAASASEVAMVLDAALTYSSATATSGGTKVTITSDTKGVSSHVEVRGGTANTALGFSPIVVDGTANPVTIETPNAGATATDAIIEFWPATFSTFGVVDSPSKSYAGNTPLTLSDRYVTVTQTGTTMTLPASPVDGQTHSIKSRAGVTTKIDSADGVLFDGALSATVGPLENRTFRYSAVIGEWEIR